MVTLFKELRYCTLPAKGNRSNQSFCILKHEKMLIIKSIDDLSTIEKTRLEVISK
jgi:hypothetical protein